MDRFERALAAFEEENSADPTRVVLHGVARPREVVNAERLAAWIDRVEPRASEALRLAARCQHLRRWEIPRASYPAGRLGYLEWRKALSRFHADRASEVLRHVGYDDATVERVGDINRKRALKLDPEVQAMEDALCLAFLEHEIDDFAAKHSPEKIVDILRKTWSKMSPRGHDLALGIPFSPPVAALVATALGAA
jgi:hypothetical protein